MFFSTLLGLSNTSQQGHKSWPHNPGWDHQQPWSWLLVAPCKYGVTLASHCDETGAKTRPEVFARAPGAAFELLTKTRVIFLEKLHQIPHTSQRDLKARTNSGSNLLSPAFQLSLPSCKQHSRPTRARWCSPESCTHRADPPPPFQTQ